MKWPKRKASNPINEGYTDFSFVKNGMEFVSDIEAEEYFDEINEDSFRASHHLNKTKDD